MSSDIMNSILRLTSRGRVQEATGAIHKALMRKPSEHSLNWGTSQPAGIAIKSRRPMGDVIGELGKFRPKLMPKRNIPVLRIPSGAKFLDGSFTCAAGSRTYKLYVPRVPSTEYYGLLVMLHGCTQNSSDFAAGTRMNEVGEVEGLLVVYPEQKTSANTSGCWNWFNPHHQLHGSGEPSIIAGITLEIIAKYNVDPRRVFVAGLSAGGAMAVVMGHTYSALFAAVGVHSGLPYRTATDIISAFAAMRGEGSAQSLPLKQRVIVFHGDEDKTVHSSNAEAIATFGNNCRSQTKNGVCPDGTAFTKTTLLDENTMRLSEHWLVHGIGHAWSGGSNEGSYCESRGPDASRLMVDFFKDRDLGATI